VVTPATKSKKFGSRYIGEGSSERDEILQLARGGGCTPPSRPVTFGQGGPMESKNIDGCKRIFVTFFSMISMKFGIMGGFREQ